MRCSLLFFVLLGTAACGSIDSPGAGGGGGGGGGGGDLANDGQLHPDWHERTVLALTNAIRFSPTDWKARWAGDDLPDTVLTSHYPAVGPVRWNAQLGSSSLAHSRDMAINGCFQHDSCDGTATWTRIKHYYTLSGTMSENIAAGYGSPESVMQGWICDYDKILKACCPDGQSCDGHRRSIMGAGYQALGVGWAYQQGSTYGDYWTQDFGGKADGATPPLVDGSHLTPSGTQLTFFANYVGTGDPREVTLVLGSDRLAMSVALGSASKGTWSVTAAASGACRTYHFEATDAAGSSWRHPQSGDLVTFQDGTCQDDFQP
jgi:hypothetical protein